MLVDPLSDRPTIVTGPANFSGASTTANDENMVAITGNKEVADIYLGEYFRLYSHYAFREAVKIFLEHHPMPSPRTSSRDFSRLVKLMERRSAKVAAVALANKMVRIACAMMARNEPYRAMPPA